MKTKLAFALIIFLSMVTGVIAGWLLLGQEKEIATSYKLYQARVSDAEAQLQNAINQRASGRALRVAVQRYYTAKFEAGKTVFAPEIQLLIKKNKDSPMKDVLRVQYQSADAPIDSVTQEPNFKTRDATREQILEQVIEAGIDPKYDTEWVNPAKDPAVRAVLEHYHKAQETMKPYWDTKDLLIQVTGKAYVDIVKEYEAAVVSGDRLRIATVEGKADWRVNSYRNVTERRWLPPFV